jgi:cAMP-dependent protein kinase regulator
LDQAGMQDVVNAFQPEQIPKGVDIIKQGDAGHCLYIIDEGQVDVFVARPGPGGQSARHGDRGTRATTLTSGALFGELALMYSTPRAATVTATSASVRTWKLDALDFKMLLMQSSQQQYAKYEGWLSHVDLLKSLNHFELSRLAEAMRSERFAAGDPIVRQGEKGDRFFILESGSASAYILGDQGEMEVKGYDRTGDYFGEIALLTSEPRKATVRAGRSGCSVVSMSATQFTNLMGPLNDLLRRQANDYPQYQDFIR